MLKDITVEDVVFTSWRVFISPATWAIVIMFVVFGILGNDDFAQEQAAMDEYCAMVKQYKETEGKAGHPDYNGTYFPYCH